MPATSRKRNKGKERRAKQLAKKEENERADAHDFWLRFCSSSTGCDHGHEIVISDNHPVSNFMDQLIINAQHKNLTVKHNLLELFKSRTHIYNNESYRKLVLDILICIGTNILLPLRGVVNTSWPRYLAHSIVVFEQYYDVDDINAVINKREVKSKLRNLECNVSSTRDLLKYFRKRTSCKCLKKMHFEARKTMPKMGRCHHCDKEMMRASLSVCSRCMINQYCSRECQVAAWPDHKSDCDEYVRAHEEQTKNEKDCGQTLH